MRSVWAPTKKPSFCAAQAGLGQGENYYEIQKLPAKCFWTLLAAELIESPKNEILFGLGERQFLGHWELSVIV